MNISPRYYSGSQTQLGAAMLIQRVSYLLCTALIVTAACAYAGRDLSPVLAIPFWIGALVCVIAIRFTRSIPGVSLALLYLMSVLFGLMMGPTLAFIVRGFALGGTIVAEAAAISGIIIAGLGTYVWISNKDFGYLGRILFWVLLALVVVGFVGMFWHSLFAMPQIYLLYELAIVAVFVGFTLYDFSNIKHRFGPNDYVIATVSLYLDFINLFWAILQILLSIAGGGSRKN